MHVNDDTLRALLDGELTPSEAEKIQTHIQTCTACLRRKAAIQEQMQMVQTAFFALEPQEFDHPRPVGAALSSFAKRTKEKKSMFNLNLKRPVWAAIVAAIAFVFAFTLPPVQALARDFLALFRVEQVNTMTLDTLNIDELSKNQTLFEALSQLFSESVSVEYGDPERYVLVNNEAQAEAEVGFDVRMPGADFQPEQLRANSAFAVKIIIDRERAQQVIDQLGTSDVVLPASLDGAEMELSSLGSVTMKYGSCPEEGQEQPDWSKECLIFTQGPSPVVTTPPDLNPQDLIESGLLVLGVSPEEAAAFSQSTDWTTTLTVPVPRGNVETREVMVDGVKGSLFEHLSTSDPDEPRGYTLVWIKDGVVYTIVGANTESRAIDLANSLAQ